MKSISISISNIFRESVHVIMTKGFYFTLVIREKEPRTQEAGPCTLVAGL